MRRRLLISTLIVAVAAVLLLGGPLAFVIGRLQVSEANQQVHRDASTLANNLQERVKANEPANAAQVGRSLPDRYVRITQYATKHTKQQVTSVGPRPPAGHTISAVAFNKLFSVTVEADDATVAAKVSQALLGIAALAALSVAVAVILAIMQARRLTRPLEELALAAERLGSGDARPLGRRYGIPELDQVA
jgi:Flp pilus assembly protein TadB